MGRCTRYRTGRASKNAKFTYGVANTYADGTGTGMPRDEVKKKSHIKEGFERGNLRNGSTKASRQKEVWKYTD